MNDKNFDSFIKKSLDGHGSPVPADMWKRVQAEKDFDPFVKQQLNSFGSPVPKDMWPRILDEKDFDTHVREKLSGHESFVPADMWQRIQHEKDFDVNVKEKLDNYKSPIPADIWQRIHPEEKKRRPIIWWWAAAASLILMAGIAASLYINHKASPNNIATNASAPSANGSQSGNGITALPNQSSSNGSPILGHDSLTIPNANNPVSKTNTDVVPNQNGSNNQSTSSPKNIFNQNGGNNQQNTHSNNQAFLGPQKSGADGNRNGNFTNTNGNNKNWKNGKETNNTSSTNNSTAANEGSNSLENQQLLNGTNALSNNERTLALKNLIRSSLANNKLMPKQLLRADKKMPSIVCPTLGPPKRNDWYVEGFVSPDYVQKNLQDKIAGKNIKTGMDSTLHRQVSFSAGVNIIKNLGENLLIKTGVQYSQVNELFKYNSGSDTRTTTVITTRDVIVSVGDTIHVRDTSTVTQTGTLTKQTQNRYKQWDIPLILGYEFGGDGFRLNANVGLIANIRSSYQGNMLDTAQKVIDIATYNNTGIYKTNIGLGVYLGLGILKPLNDNMDLLIEPHARFNLSSMTTDAAIFNQKNTVLGLSVGIRYKINGRGQRY